MAMSVLDVRGTVGSPGVAVSSPGFAAPAALRRVPMAALAAGGIAIVEGVALLAVALTGLDGVLSSPLRPAGPVLAAGLLALAGWIVLCAGSGAALIELLRSRVLDPIGMHSADPRLDAAGTFIGSSYVFATARDFVRFGQLYLHDGVHAGRRILPEGWVAHGRRLRSNDEKGNGYGAHWWVVDDDTFRASGYEGQRIWVTPDLDLVVVRMGRSTTEQGDELRHWYDALIAAMR